MRGGPNRNQGPKNLSGSRGASPVLRVRVTPELLAESERKAASAGLSLADWVRMSISATDTTKSGDGPLVQENWKSYLRFDSIGIRVDDGGRMVIEFSWDGKQTHGFSADMPKTPAEKLVLSGISGLCPVSII